MLNEPPDTVLIRKKKTAGKNSARLLIPAFGKFVVIQLVIVGKIPVEKVIETAKKTLYTGHIGDGKIFVYDVAQVVKVRTGEEGIEALQDVE